MSFLFNLNVGTRFYQKILLEKYFQLCRFMEMQQTIFNRAFIKTRWKRDFEGF